LTVGFGVGALIATPLGFAPVFVFAGAALGSGAAFTGAGRIGGRADPLAFGAGKMGGRAI
jgi:hypothetical protein